MAKFCGVCDEEMSQGETWDSHNVSESHKKQAHLRECSIELEIEGGWHGVNQTSLIKLFQRFGPIVRINMSTRQYPLAGLGMIEFANANSLQKVLQQTYYKVMTKGGLVKVSRWLSDKKRQANEELEERERSLYQEKDRRFQEDLYNTVKLAAMTDQQMSQLAWMQEITQNELKLAGELRADIETIIQAYIPECKVHLIGSTNNGLGVRGCDMNFEVTFDPRAQRKSVEYLPEAPVLPEMFVHQSEVVVVDGRLVYGSFRTLHLYQAAWFLYEILNKSNLTLKMSRLGLQARPSFKDWDIHERPCDCRHNNFISFKYLKLHMDCELHIKMSDSLNQYSTELVSLLVRLDERVRTIYLAVRYWAKKVQIFESLRSGVLFLLVYHYLQNTKPPVLPSVETLTSMIDRKQRHIVRDCDVSFCTDTAKIKEQCLPTTNTQKLSELLQGFYRYYCRYDLSNRVFCPHSGKAFNILKFRNMKKIIPTLARFPITDRFLHVQDLFRQDMNVVERCSRVMMHQVCAEMARAEVLTRGVVSTWNLLTLVPKDTIDHTEQDSQLKHIRIPFVSACLPDGFLGYQSYAEAESQWYQWIVEITMRCLKILRVHYTLHGDYGRELAQDGNKRQMIEDAAARKRRGNWSTLLDEDRAKDFTHTFEPTYDMIQESRLRCDDQYNLWKTRSPRARNNKSCHFDKEENITEKQIAEFEKFREQARAFQFTLTVSHVKSVNETLVDIFGSDTTSTFCSNNFMNFFHEFLSRKIGIELGMDYTMFDRR